MILAASYSFNNGHSAIKKKYPDLLQEIKDAITSVNALDCKTKKSKEKTMRETCSTPRLPQTVTQLYFRRTNSFALSNAQVTSSSARRLSFD